MAGEVELESGEATSRCKKRPAVRVVLLPTQFHKDLSCTPPLHKPQERSRRLVVTGNFIDLILKVKKVGSIGLH